MQLKEIEIRMCQEKNAQSVENAVPAVSVVSVFYVVVVVVVVIVVVVVVAAAVAVVVKKPCQKKTVNQYLWRFN